MSRLLSGSLRKHLAKGSVGAATALSALVLSGCGGAAKLTPTEIDSNPVGGAALSGRVHGGQNPISGASVYLYAANTTGSGGPGESKSTSNQSISLLTSGTQDGSGHYYVTTGSDGSFSVTGDYSCPSANSQLYLFAVGGNSGAGTNSAAGLLAGLGTCSAVVASPPYVVMNEVSTIATAFAVAGFATDATHISSSGSMLAEQDIANAFEAIPNLETLGTGVALTSTPSGIGTAPQKTVNTLANVLAGCINSAGPTSSPCTTLFDNEANDGLPTETASAAICLAQNPAKAISTIYDLQTAGAPFQPSLTALPNDLSLSISYAATNLYTPNWPAVDASGNVWVSVGATSSAGHNGTLMEFSPSGQLISGAGGYNSGLTDPYRVAIDHLGNPWVLNDNSGSYALAEFGPSGTPGSTFTNGLSNQPEDFAFDKSGDIWIANFEGGSGSTQGSIMELNSSGGTIQSGLTGGGVDGPIGLAIDVSGNVWAGNFYDGISEFTSAGVAKSGVNGIEGAGGGDEDEFIAIGLSGDVWAVGFDAGGVTELNSSGTILSSSGGYEGGSNFYPADVATDGAGNVWVTNYVNNSVSEWSPAGFPVGNTGAANGLTGPEMADPWGLAIDGSGNVWVANLGATGTAGTVTEFIGVAVPIVTPVVSNLLSPYGSADVNRP
jgi:streptogramin lyase